MLFEERPGESYEYGSILILPAVSQELMRRVLYPPEKVPEKLDGHSAYRAAFGGFFWFFIVSGHSARFPHQEVFLSKDGDLHILKVGGPAVEFIQHLASDFAAAGMLSDPKRQNRSH